MIKWGTVPIFASAKMGLSPFKKATVIDSSIPREMAGYARSPYPGNVSIRGCVRSRSPAYCGNFRAPPTLHLDDPRQSSGKRVFCPKSPQFFPLFVQELQSLFNLFLPFSIMMRIGIRCREASFQGCSALRQPRRAGGFRHPGGCEFVGSGQGTNSQELPPLNRFFEIIDTECLLYFILLINCVGMEGIRCAGQGEDGPGRRSGEISRSRTSESAVVCQQFRGASLIRNPLGFRALWFVWASAFDHDRVQ